MSNCNNKVYIFWNSPVECSWRRKRQKERSGTVLDELYSITFIFELFFKVSNCDSWPYMTWKFIVYWRLTKISFFFFLKDCFGFKRQVIWWDTSFKRTLMLNRVEVSNASNCDTIYCELTEPMLADQSVWYLLFLTVPTAQHSHFCLSFGFCVLHTQ